MKPLAKQALSRISIDNYSNDDVVYKKFLNIYINKNYSKEILENSDINLRLNKNFKKWLLYLIQTLTFNKKNYSISIFNLLGLKLSWRFLKETNLNVNAEIIYIKNNFLILIYNTESSKYVIKLPYTKKGNIRFKNEVDSLLKAKEINNKSIRVPELIYYSLDQDKMYLKEKYITGTQILNKNVQSNAFQKVFNFISDFYFLNTIEFTKVPNEYLNIDFYIRELIKENSKGSSIIDNFEKLAGQNQFLLKSRIHGDLSISNLIEENDKIYLIDWEKSRFDFIMIDLKSSSYNTESVYNNIIDRLKSQNINTEMVYNYKDQLFLVLYIELVRFIQNEKDKNFKNLSYKKMITGRINKILNLIGQ